MSDPFIGELRPFGFNFAPKGWAFCNGQLLPISQNTALFSLLGTQYGGNGTTNFALPNLQANVPIGQGQGPGLTNRVIGDTSGSNTITLTLNDIPQHNHPVNATTAESDTQIPTNNLLADANRNSYVPTPLDALMSDRTVGVVGSNFPHNNMQPYLVVNYCIAMSGIFPPRG